jgi:sialic acid synthase SpsE
MLCNGIKMPARSEAKTRTNNRKSIVTAHGLKEGQVILPEDIAVKRPGYGIAPKYLHQIVGRTAGRRMEQDEVFSWEDLR